MGGQIDVRPDAAIAGTAQSSLSSRKDPTISQTIAGVIAVSGPDGGPMSCCGASAA
jgi:hypothetical protein